MADKETRLPSQPNRIRASGPILILAALFLVATFLAWYFTWFGRGLSDADISKYLNDTRNPRHVQHALLQIQHRIERGDPSARNWYPQILTLSSSPETEFRLTVAWLMGFVAFHVATGLVHILLLIALVAFVMHFVTGRTTV